jgi:hypothetical protein
MSSVQNQIQSQIPPEIIEIIRKARRYGPEFVTPYERQLLTRYFERHLLDVIVPTVTEPIVDLSVCVNELCRKCKLCSYYFDIDYVNAYELCTDRKIVRRGAYIDCFRGVKIGMCLAHGSIWDLTESILKLVSQLANEPIRVRPSKTTKSGYEYILYHAKLLIQPRIPPPNSPPNYNNDNDYDRIRIEDYNPRRFAASLLYYLTVYGYYMPHL